MITHMLKLPPENVLFGIRAIQQGEPNVRSHSREHLASFYSSGLFAGRQAIHPQSTELRGKRKIPPMTTNSERLEIHTCEETA